MVSGGKTSSIQFRVWELNSPVHPLINRAFLNLVVMGGMGLPAVGLSRAAPRSDEPPSVAQSRIAGKKIGAQKGPYIFLVVMGGIEPPTYGL